MKFSFLPNCVAASAFSLARTYAIFASIMALFFVGASASAQDSTTNTNEYFPDPYFGTFTSSESLFGDDSSGMFGTLSFGGSSGGLPLDGGIEAQNQAVVTLSMREASFPTTFFNGGGYFNQGTDELGMYANVGGSLKQAAAWSNFGTSGLNGSGASLRSLQVGDVFRITVSATRAFGQIGFSLNEGGAQGGGYDNRNSGSRLYVNTDNFGSWYVNRSGGNSVLGFSPIENTYKNYQFTIRITSATTADVYLTVDGTDYRAYNLVMNGSAGANISALSIYVSDDWDGSSHENVYWKPSSQIENTGRVELGYFLASGNFDPGQITDGLQANSTSATSANEVHVGGDAGSAVLLNQENTYTGSTTVNANATVRASHANAFGTTAGGVTVSSGGRIQLSGDTAVGNEALSLSGVGISTSGALQNTSGNNSWSGAVTLSGNARINSDAGTLTLSGGITGGNNVLFLGGAANTVLSGAISGDGGSQDGTTSIYKDGGGALTLSGANNFAGQTLLRLGTILVGNNAAFGSGTLQIHFADFTGIKVLASTDETTRTLSNAMNIFGSNLSLGATDRTGSLIFNGNINLGNDTASGNSRTITTAAGTSHTFGGIVSGNTANLLIKSGTGTLALNGNNIFNAGLQLNDGAILVGNNNALGSGTLQVQFDVGGTKTLASSSSSSFTLGNSVNIFNNLTIGRSGDANGSLTLSGNVFLGNEVNANRTLILVGDHAISGVISGSRGIVKQGTGQLTLSGNNTSTGVLYIDDGTINLNGGSLGAGTIEIGAGTVGAAAATLKVSSGSFSRGVTVNSDAGAGDRTIDFANSTGTATLSGAVALEKTVSASVGNSAATGVFSGVISGSGGLTKTGSGTLTLSGDGANTYAGVTTISGGVLNLNKNAGLNAIAGNVSVASNATLLVSQSNQVNNSAAVTLSGGTITRASGVSEVFGNLNLTAASFLNFGSGTAGSVQFGTYARDTESALLTVQNFFQGNSLVFSQNLVASGFIASSSSGSYNNGYFAFADGFTTSWNGTDTFTITAIPEPSTYVAAAGLLALFLWPVRRRLIKDAKSILGLRAPARERLEAYRNV
jgi:autotransporter-associated beta strand protein